MYKKILFWIFALVLLTSLTNAALIDDLAHYYELDNTTWFDSAANGGDMIPGTGTPTVIAGGVFGNQANFSKTASQSIYNDSPIIQQYPFSVSAWFNVSPGVVTSSSIFGVADFGASNEYLGVWTQGGTCYFIARSAALNDQYNTAQNCDNTRMHLVAIYRNASDRELYINGTSVVNRTGTVVFPSGTERIAIGKIPRDSDLALFDGAVDEVGFWNRTLTSSEVASLYNSGSGLAYPFSGGGPPGNTINLSNTTPIDQEAFNVFPIFFNVSVNASANFDCDLNINGTTNLTQANIANGTNISVSFNQSGFENSPFIYNITCNTTSDTVGSTDKTFYVDFEPPQLNGTNFQNNTIFFLENITGNWNFTDNDQIHSLNVTIDNITITNLTGLAQQVYWYNLSYNVSGLAAGDHNLSFVVADGHTAEILRSANSYNPKNGLFNSYLRYDFSAPYRESYIKINGDPNSLFETFSTQYNGGDRYKITYKPKTKGSTYLFTVESDEKIYIYSSEDGKYGGDWLVIGEHWLDFNIPTEPNLDVSIEQVDDYNVLVQITGVNPNTEVLVFDSIGDLNIVQFDYNVGVVNTTTVLSTAVSELQDQTINFSINTTSSLVTNTNVTITWNATDVGATKIINADEDLYTDTFLTPQVAANTNVTIVINYNISSLLNDETGSFTFNQTIFRIGIDNCSTYTTRAINISLRNESSNALVTGSIDGYFQVWVSDINSFEAFNLTWDGASQYGLCIDPNDATYIASAQMEYEATGFSDKTYYFVNTTLDNSTDLLDLFLTPATQTVTLSVTDQNDNALSDVFIHILSYDLGTDSYLTTEIVRTDFNGEALAQMVLNTQWYRFMLVHSGETRLFTDPTRLTSTTLSFRLNLIEDYFENFNIVQNITCTLTFNNATNTFNYNFNNPDGSTVTATLDIKLIEDFSDDVVNTSSLTSASGTILLTIPAGNETYLATGTIFDDGERYVCGPSVSVDQQKDYETWGAEGIFLSFLLVITLVMVGIWNPMVAVIMMIIGVVFSVLIGSFYLSLPVLIAFIILGAVTVYRLNK